MEFIISNGVPWGERSFLLKSGESLFYGKERFIFVCSLSVVLLSSCLVLLAQRPGDEEGQQCQL
jgi:hypothetical protein